MQVAGVASCWCAADVAAGLYENSFAIMPPEWLGILMLL